MMDSVAAQHADWVKPSGKKAVKWSRWFILSASGILLVTGLAKISSAFGGARALQVHDPLFGVQFRHLMLSIGSAEIVIAYNCFFTARPRLSLGLIACMAANFMVYRIGLSYIGWHGPCHCVGSLTDALHISAGLGGP